MGMCYRKKGDIFLSFALEKMDFKSLSSSLLTVKEDEFSSFCKAVICSFKLLFSKISSVFNEFNEPIFFRIRSVEVFDRGALSFAGSESLNFFLLSAFTKFESPYHRIYTL